MLAQFIYNPHHFVREDRIAKHMKKCREYYLKDPTCRQYDNAKRISVCHYNPSHHVNSYWLRHHHNSCPDSIPNAANCIYNFFHVVRKDRLAKHLEKCRRHYLQDSTSPYHERAKSISVCPYNPNHHEFFLEQHYRSCPDINKI